MTAKPAKHVCAQPVSDHTGFHFWACGKPAKWLVTDKWDGKFYRCGIHAKRLLTDQTKVAVKP